MRKALVLALLSAAPAVAVACGAFDSDADPPAGADASSEAAPVPTTTAGDAGDGGVEVEAGSCVPEPPWATPEAVDAGTTTGLANCDALINVPLLTSREHCGRCGHSCGAQPCVLGVCAPEIVETMTGPIVPVGARGAALIYIAFDAIRSYTPGVGSTSLVDTAGSQLYGATVDDALGLAYFQTYSDVFRVPLALDAGARRIYGGQHGGVRALSSSGSVAFGLVDRFVAMAADAGDPDAATTLVNEAVADVAPTPSGIAVLTKGWTGSAPTSSVITSMTWRGTSAQQVAAGESLVAIGADGSHVYALQATGPNAGVVRAAIPPTAAGLAPFAAEPSFPSASLVQYGLLAVDQTHVYWSRPISAGSAYVDVLKKAKCGGAAVVIARDVYAPSGLVALGDSLYLGVGSNKLVRLVK